MDDQKKKKSPFNRLSHLELLLLTHCASPESDNNILGLKIPVTIWRRPLNLLAWVNQSVKRPKAAREGKKNWEARTPYDLSTSHGKFSPVTASWKIGREYTVIVCLTSSWLLSLLAKRASLQLERLCKSSADIAIPVEYFLNEPIIPDLMIY